MIWEVRRGAGRAERLRLRLPPRSRKVLAKTLAERDFRFTDIPSGQQSANKFDATTLRSMTVASRHSFVTSSLGPVSPVTKSCTKLGCNQQYQPFDLDLFFHYPLAWYGPLMQFDPPTVYRLTFRFSMLSHLLAPPFEPHSMVSSNNGPGHICLDRMCLGT